MADVNVRMEQEVFVRKGVQHAILLHVGTSSYDNRTDIASEHGTGSHVASSPDRYVADQYRQRMDERLGIHCRTLPFKLVPGHHKLSFLG